MKQSKKQLILTIIFLSICIGGLIFGFLGVQLKLNWMILIFGLAAITTMIINLFLPLIFRGRIGVLSWISVLISLFGVIVFICVSIIQNVALLDQDVVVPVVSACISGLLTLYGVALTIKHNGLEQRETELRKYMPHIYAAAAESMKNVAAKEVEYKGVKDGVPIGNSIFFEDILIVNTDLSICTLDGLFINKKFVKFKYEYMILKNSRYKFHLNFGLFFTEEVETIRLVLSDCFGNIYTFNTGFDKQPSKGNKKTTYRIKSVFLPKLLENHYYSINRNQK